MARKQLHLAAHFPGVNNTTVWSDPRSRSQIEFSSFRDLARTAEEGTFDFFFLAEGLRLREVHGQIHDLDVVGRPESITVLTALAAVTTHLGLAATVNATFNEPYELARRFASLDHLSGGRAAWNVVTSSDAFTGENFRRGGFLDHADRYTRASEFVSAARTLWDSWTDDDLIADRRSGRFAAEGAGRFSHRGQHFDIAGEFTVPRSPQGHPVVIQAGDSADGRDFAAAQADVIFTRHGTLEAGQAFYADVKSRLAAHGRTPDSLKIMPGVSVVVGDTDAEAEEKAAHIRSQQVSGATAIATAELLWGIDLSDRDPDGPLPLQDPVVGSGVVRGRVGFTDPVATVAQWREAAESHGWSLRQTVIAQQNRQSFIGSADTIARQLDSYVQADAADGYILVPHLTPGGLDDFVAKVVPLLRERGVFRSEYTGRTLRDHLQLPTPQGAASGAA
ncbi:NtaA/DmoA family FMN-dependent monooxygenase [Nakamurella lactea]|uniref:NtaA/DmoA family FMN-dependent monooxygenase n=1 Tax=Nakamurella lactea TaxID=459515 RepID=UPI0004045ECD|nr:NtaA/DmoA family FMN-dependent monooxygenase [Nakamurella lactea]